ncbi:hypothetical protein [Desulfobotulus mexicanus]|uniref:VWFA domain-containing protein n=1 Tax=Desulfobotulus mexicanus TaxID=2586642 RepID=A0A5S5MCQ6_9BACT|nr:hypothetical protein [Desulfobotulus mexicanus]TYT73494.1 hypothetical protein FIM25_14910 [Desulfobotulus mexicanus]
MTGNTGKIAILKSLPLLAGVLGKSYGIRVEIGGSQAYTNGSVIFLPQLPEQSDPDFMGLVRGYIDHESAHIRETDFSILENMIPIEKNIWNILEDWRVEGKLAAVFPGCRQNFNWLIRRLFAGEGDGGHAHADSSVVILNWLLLTVRSWDVAEIGIERDHLARILDTRWPGLKSEVEEVLEQVRRYCPDSFACLRYANDIMDILNIWAEREAAQEKLEEGGTEQGAGQEQGNEGGEDSGSITQDENLSAGSETEAQKNEGGEHCSSGSDTQDQGQEGGGDSAGFENQDDTSSTGQGGSDSEGLDGSSPAGQDGTLGSESLDSSMDSSHGSCLDEKGTNSSSNSPYSGGSGSQDEGFDDGLGMDLIPIYEADLSPEKIGWLLTASESELPEDLGSSIAKTIESKAAGSSNRVEVASVSPKELMEIGLEEIRQIRAATSGMRNRFHALFQSMKDVRSTPSRTGKINTKNLYSMVQGNQKLFLRHGSRQGINTAVHILLDVSSSMRKRISLASQVCHAVAQTLELVGINTGVTAFPGKRNLENPNGVTVTPMVRHGEAIHNRFYLDVKGSTPMGEAIWWVLQEMIHLKEPRKMVFVITDGMPDCMNMAVRAIDAGVGMGVEFYGIGIDSPVVHSLLPGSSVNISNLDELAQAVFTMLGRTFKQAN